MVYDKARSGDPDYDDKVPQEQHAGGVVISAGDGVILSKVTGPVDAEGAHVNLAHAPSDLDNRPSPGNVAEKASEVQDYEPEDTPTFMEPTPAQTEHIDQVTANQEAIQKAHVITSADAAAGVASASEDGHVADESHTRSGDITAAKGENASAAPKKSTSK